jgi:hypothetical protein
LGGKWQKKKADPYKKAIANASRKATASNQSFRLLESVAGWNPHLRIEMWGTRCVWRHVVGLRGWSSLSDANLALISYQSM